MIHCDEVFDILTRGPFPTGAPSDGIVESHLNHCDACRQLAEALRPAIELLQEAIESDECDSLPRYGGAAVSRTDWSDGHHTPLSTKQLIVRPMTRAATTLRQKTVAWPWRSAGKFVAAACVGLALAGLLRQIAAPHHSFPRASAVPVAVAANWRLDTDGRQWAVEHGLSDRCREIINGVTVVAAPGRQTMNDTLQLACCLGCHQADRNHRLPPERVGGFVQACQACHE